MNERTEWLDNLHSAASAVQNALVAVNRVAHIMQEAGNDHIAARLWAVAERLDEAHQNLRDGTGKAVADRLHNAQEASATMFKAVLAGLSAAELAAIGRRVAGQRSIVSMARASAPTQTRGKPPASTRS